MTLGPNLLILADLVRGLVLVGTLLVVGKAVVAYRQHDSRPMLLLGVGLFLLLVVPPAFEYAATAVLDSSSLPLDLRPTTGTIGALVLTEELIRLSGLAALLGSLYVRE